MNANSVNPRRRARNAAAFAGLEAPAIHPLLLTALPAIAIIALAFALAWDQPAWVFMWSAAAGLFIAAKWCTALSHFLRQPDVSPGRLLAYVFLWPGMNAKRFCADIPPAPIAPAPLLWALAKTLTGAALIAFAASLPQAGHPILIGWLAMIGIVLLLHFGFFDLLSLAWRARGADAQPIMRAPITAVSLANLWSGKWNSAFSDLMHTQFFVRLMRRLGPNRAIAVIFLISGVLHEFVISMPAGGGYGLPTAYFALQGAGIAFERTDTGRQLGLGARATGRLFVLILAAIPAYWLFSPLFIRNVILPMLNAIPI